MTAIHFASKKTYFHYQYEIGKYIIFKNQSMDFEFAKFRHRLLVTKNSYTVASDLVKLNSFPINQKTNRTSAERAIKEVEGFIGVSRKRLCPLITTLLVLSCNYYNDDYHRQC